MKLCKDAVSADLWDLLQCLMAAEVLSDFYLAGGTALALRFGHRVSVDLDLFISDSFESEVVADRLIREHGMAEVTAQENTVSGWIHGIKVDCLAHRYPLVADPECVDGVRMLSTPDIVAMKLNAIANRGSKKDFWDLYELKRNMSRQELLSYYTGKYPNGNRWAVERALSYFDDAEREPDPMCLKGRRWDQIKEEIALWNRL